VGKSIVIYVNFFRDIASPKLLKSVNVSLSYSKNITLAVHSLLMLQFVTVQDIGTLHTMQSTG